MARDDARPRPPRLSPVRRQRMYEVLADHIVAFVEAQGLTPGQRLPPERALAEQLGVSRATLSQALVALEVKGVVDVRHGDGTVLVPPADRHPGRPDDEASRPGGDTIDPPPSLAEAGEALAALVPALAALAAQRRGEAEAEALGAVLAADGPAAGPGRDADPARGVEPDRAASSDGTAGLVSVLGPLSRSPVVAAMAQQAIRLAAEAQDTAGGPDPGRGEDGAGPVAAVLQAVVRGDADAAREAAAAHVRWTARQLDALSGAAAAGSGDTAG